MKHYQTNFFDKKIKPIIHLDGVQQPGDMSICGSGLIGDSHLGWYAAIETDQPVNCISCCKIISACKTVTPSEYKSH